jgi:hypothetical protein
MEIIVIALEEEIHPLGFSSSYVYSNIQHSHIAHGATDHKQNSFRSWQVLEMLPVVMYFFKETGQIQQYSHTHTIGTGTSSHLHKHTQGTICR